MVVCGYPELYIHRRTLTKLLLLLSQHFHIIALLLVLIASIVFICNPLWIKASAKCNANVSQTFTQIQTETEK